MAKRGKDQPQPQSRPPPFVSSGVPLYYQLATLLRQKIVSREYNPGDQFPTEAELVESYGVSRITVRQALSSLEGEGLIQRQVGRGTFVTDKQPFTGTLELDCSIDDLISMGLATSVKVLELREMAATPEEARDLDVPEGSPVVRCRRLRYYKDEPYCYIVNHMPLEIGRHLKKRNWRQGSVLKFIEEQLGIPLRIAQQRLRATLADAHLARWLQVRIGAPLLLVDYHIRTDENRPVEMAQLYYRSDIYAFTLHLTRGGGESEQKQAWALKDLRFEH